jgi:redox-sensitive bicupin YhaK (pirin superfamily)
VAEDLLVRGLLKDLGGFSVARLLPSRTLRSVGPFVFVDHMGPLHLDQEHALDVRPHPHIGLATVTYLFSGRGLHRDSLGNELLIEPGDLNWMTAGRGIAHSERTPKEDRVGDHVFHGLQIWVALPVAEEDCEPSFTHYGRATLPELSPGMNLKGRLLLGTYVGMTSPVKTFSRMLLMNFSATGTGEFVFAVEEKQIAVMAIEGGVTVNGHNLSANDLLFVSDPHQIEIQFTKGSHFVIFGGEPFPEPRHMWWNFVSSKKEKIRAAAEKWLRGDRPPVVHETEFIPLPTEPLP